VTFTFRKAVRENVSLLIALAGGTGSGKTYTAMRLASGISQGKPFAVIDTEAGRAKHYADKFLFDHGDLQEPFSPSAYADAIGAADKAGYPVIVVDSFSHEWAGYGGVLDMQDTELDRMAGDDWKKREACKMAAWIKPKGEHKKMMQKLLQVRAQLILCFRAEEKIEMVRGEDGKMKIQPKQSLTGLAGWIPICEKNLPFEATCSFLLTADAPGVPKPIKLQEQHKALFPLDKPITEASGASIFEWARGAKAPPAERASAPPDEVNGSEFITPDQCANLETLCQDNNVPLDRLRKVAKVERLAQILAADYDRALTWIKKHERTA
jgi:AAA domain